MLIRVEPIPVVDIIIAKRVGIIIIMGWDRTNTQMGNALMAAQVGQ